MAKSNILSAEVLAALEANGVVPNYTRRVVIDIQMGEVPIIHIERIGDMNVIKVVEALTGVEVERVESPPAPHPRAAPTRVIRR